LVTSGSPIRTAALSQAKPAAGLQLSPTDGR
jgi:hypothetical protein